MKKENKERLFEVMGRLDKTFKSKLNEDKDPCWDDHEMVGMKKKDGKEVPNCVPKNEGVELSETDDPKAKDRDRERQDVSQKWERADDYERLFIKTIKAHGYKPNELDDMSKEEKRKFFDELDKKWISKEEK